MLLEKCLLKICFECIQLNDQLSGASLSPFCHLYQIFTENILNPKGSFCKWHMQRVTSILVGGEEDYFLS